MSEPGFQGLAHGEILPDVSIHTTDMLVSILRGWRQIVATDPSQVVRVTAQLACDQVTGELDRRNTAVIAARARMGLT